MRRHMIVKTGLHILRENKSIGKNWGKVGLLCNQASVDIDYKHSVHILKDIFNERLTTLFGPQHGFEATVQDNMIETTHARHKSTGLPIYSLYSDRRRPTKQMLENVDTLIIDLQVTGCRVYTFKWTVAECLRAAHELGKKIVILDRPNPVQGNVVEGRVLEANMHSFVGQSPIPMRHALTMGELGQFVNREIGADLEVISMIGWDPHKDFTFTGLPWVITSPNLPTIDAVFTYPGTVIFEGTNVSEGRGTGLPFQFIGAPFLDDSAQLRGFILDHWPEACAGVVLRPCAFQPTSSKWAGQTCTGIQIHVTQPEKIRSYALSLAILRACIDLGNGRFEWTGPGYEYNFTDLPINLILGSNSAHEAMRAAKFSPNDAYWSKGLKDYIKDVEPSLLYPRTITAI